MAKSYKVDTYRRHVYRLRPTPRLAIAATLEPMPDLEPAAVAEDAVLGASAEIEDAGMSGAARPDAPVAVLPWARPEPSPALGDGTKVRREPALDPRAEAPSSPALHDGEVKHAELPPPAHLTWIELELLGEDGAPLGGRPYAITMADGTIRYGRLGADGRARIAEMEPDRCVVRFLDLDRGGWELMDDTPAPARSWIEVELLGEDGSPRAGEPFVVREASGRVRRGVLDGAGTARVEGLDPGTCSVSFPELDRTAWEAIS